jgi:kynureninase
VNLKEMLNKAKELDLDDKLSGFRSEFYFPKTEAGKDFLYFCGNSLGLQPKSFSKLLAEETQKWQNLAVEGHFSKQKPWLSYHKLFENGLAKLTGALPSEVIAMNALTVNLHLLLQSFYNPTDSKFKIAIERNAFPSDLYAVQSLVDLYIKKGIIRNGTIDDCIFYLEPNTDGIYGTKSILNQIEDDTIALLLLSGVNYQTGEAFDLEIITDFCARKNIVVGLDLAHAIGNVPLQLHKWKVDFAVWCSYKYLNAGPGAVGGAFVHEMHCKNQELPKLHGWWSNKEETRFQMKSTIEPYQTAESWQLSNAPIFNMIGLLASLGTFEKVDLNSYFEKSQRLTSFLFDLISQELPKLKIITPKQDKGCQLSILIENPDSDIKEKIHTSGIIVDWRNHPKGLILRIAPVPLYNSFEDCAKFVDVLLDTRIKT